MEKKSLGGRLITEWKSFLEQIRRSNEAAYLVLLTLYVVIWIMLKVAWVADIEKPIDAIRFGMLSIVMWGSALYLFFVIVDWKKLLKNLPALIITGAAILSLCIYFSVRMSTNAYGVVFDMFFCLMACGKDYKKILRCVMWTAIVMLLISGIGVLAGFTLDLQKPDNISPGHSLGINYPNTWGYIAFLALMIAWYLYMRHRPFITFPAFWGTALFMYFIISCRTVALLTVVFPVLAVVVDLIVRKAIKEESSIGVIGWLIVAMPIFEFAFMLFVSLQYNWVHATFYNTALHTMAMRFVQGGLFFKTFGVPFVGNTFRANVHSYVNVNGSFEEVGILDSSFACYLIIRGALWMACVLGWLCFANYKAVKRRDYAIPFLSGIILVFAMMERPGLDVWYNFILLYPLAKVADDPLEVHEQVLGTGETESVAFENVETTSNDGEMSKQFINSDSSDTE